MAADHIDRAAEIIYVEVLGLPDYSPDAVDDHNRHSYRGDCECNAPERGDARHAAEDLDAAGLLVTPEHDAAVAAKVLREVVEIFDGDCIDLADELRWTTDAPKGWSEGSVAFAIEATLLFGPWLTARANRIEREAGESDADA